jgi:hypothetical protein
MIDKEHDDFMNGQIAEILIKEAMVEKNGKLYISGSTLSVFLCNFEKFNGMFDENKEYEVKREKNGSVTYSRQ